MAAKAVRLDQPVMNPDGSISVTYRSGAPPLADGPGSEGMTFPNHEALAEAIAVLDAGFSAEQLALMNLARWVNQDPTLAFPSIAKGKQIIVDFGVANTITLTG